MMSVPATKNMPSLHPARQNNQHDDCRHGAEYIIPNLEEEECIEYHSCQNALLADLPEV